MVIRGLGWAHMPAEGSWLCSAITCRNPPKLVTLQSGLGNRVPVRKSQSLHAQVTHLFSCSSVSFHLQKAYPL